MDRTQQDALYAEARSTFGAELQRLARAYDANSEQQRDLLQEIHLELWRSFLSFDGRCSLRTWVFRIAHNVGASHVARSVRSPRLVDLETLAGDAVTAAAGAEMERKLSAAMLLHLVHRLKLIDRQVILLYLEGEEASAIAEVTGLSAANVATKIHRIKKLLKQQYSEGASHAAR